MLVWVCASKLSKKPSNFFVIIMVCLRLPWVYGILFTIFLIAQFEKGWVCVSGRERIFRFSFLICIFFFDIWLATTEPFDLIFTYFSFLHSWNGSIKNCSLKFSNLIHNKKDKDLRINDDGMKVGRLWAAASTQEDRKHWISVISDSQMDGNAQNMYHGGQG